MEYIKAVEKKLKKQGFSEEQIAVEIKKIMNPKIMEENEIITETEVVEETPVEEEVVEETPVEEEVVEETVDTEVE